jgi:hypothetical protein
LPPPVDAALNSLFQLRLGSSQIAAKRLQFAIGALGVQTLGEIPQLGLMSLGLCNCGSMQPPT